MGTRLYHSDDNGSNWQVENTPAVNFNDLIFLPTKIIAATSNGLFVSYNNGINWISHNTGISNADSIGNIVDIAQKGNRLLIVSQTGVYYSDNDGGSWTASIATTGLRSMAVINNTILTSKISGIWTSNDNGLTFTASSNMGIVGANPNIRDILVFNNEVYCRKIGSLEVYKSTDNGLNWQLINSGITGSSVLSLITVDSKLFVTTSDGVFELNVLTSNWLSSSLSPVEPLTILHNNNGKYFAYSPAIAHLISSISNGNNWIISDTNIYMQNAQILSVTSNNNLFILGSNIYHFNQLDSTWNRFIPYSFDFSGNVATTAVVGVYSIAFGAGNQYYVATSGGVWRSNDNGATWIQGATGLPVTSSTFNYKTVKDLYISGDTIIAATTLGIYRSLDQANTWQQVFNLNTADLYKYGNYLYAAGNGVYRSADNGNTWTAFAGATSGGPFETISGAGGKIFIGAFQQVGLFADTTASSFTSGGASSNFIGYEDKLFLPNSYIDVNINTTNIINMADNLPCYYASVALGCHNPYLYVGQGNCSIAIYDEKIWIGGSGFSTWYRSLGDFGFPVSSKEESSTTIELKVYPNPANDKIFINGIDKESKIIIYNNLGQIQQINSNLDNCIDIFDNGIDISESL
jgi:hypothetical protein